MAVGQALDGDVLVVNRSILICLAIIFAFVVNPLIQEINLLHIHVRMHAVKLVIVLILALVRLLSN